MVHMMDPLGCEILALAKREGIARGVKRVFIGFGLHKSFTNHNPTLAYIRWTNEAIWALVDIILQARFHDLPRQELYEEMRGKLPRPDQPCQVWCNPVTFRDGMVRPFKFIKFLIHLLSILSVVQVVWYVVLSLILINIEHY